VSAPATGSRTELGEWLAGFLRDPVFLAKYPYYAAILARMEPVADPSVRRMAVSLHEGRFYLHVDVEAFVREPMYLRGVLLHEVHHVALGHLSHPKFAGAEVPELMDLALEMSANEYVVEPLPDPITWRPYAAFGLRAGQSTLERYERLVEAHRGGALTAGGAAAPGSPARAGAAARIGGRRSLEAAEAMMRAGRVEEPGPPRTEPTDARVDEHRFLRKPLRPLGAVERTRELVERAAEDAERIRPDLRDEGAEGRLVAGRRPGRLVEELTGTLGPAESVLDWASALRMFVTRERAPVHTYARPSRRFPADVGRVPGRSWSPRLIHRPRLLVAIDTSMSMTAAELAEIARQLARMSELARIVVAECDVEVTRVYPFAGALSEVAGRGGTDLRPVFEASLLGAERPDGVVYFTDGLGPFPERAPTVPVLWVLTKPEAFACPWGARARLERKGEAKKAARRGR
jgi:predicted metal-dependent peptidase